MTNDEIPINKGREDALCLRFFSEDGGDRLILVNLGSDLEMTAASESLLAPPRGRRWAIRWSSEDPRYGGEGVAPLFREEILWIPGQSALVLWPLP